MEAIKQLNSFSEIPEGVYIGYHWRSDSQVAVIGSIPRELDMNGNPFVMEGNWYSTEGDYCVTYRNTGEGGMLHLVNRKAFNNAHILKRRFEPSSGMSGVDFLEFESLWQPEEDPICEGFEVLTPVKMVLVNMQPNKLNHDSKSPL